MKKRHFVMSLYLSSGNMSQPSQWSHSNGILTQSSHTIFRNRATCAQACCPGDRCDIACRIRQGPAQLPVLAVSCHALNTTHILAGDWSLNQKFYRLLIVLTENALPPLVSSGNPSHPARSSDSCSPLSVPSSLWVCLMMLS